MPKRVISPDPFPGSYWKSGDEVHSFVVSGPIPYTLLARLSIGL